MIIAFPGEPVEIYALHYGLSVLCVLPFVPVVILLFASLICLIVSCGCCVCCGTGSDKADDSRPREGTSIRRLKSEHLSQAVSIRVGGGVELEEQDGGTGSATTMDPAVLEERAFNCRLSCIASLAFAGVVVILVACVPVTLLLVFMIQFASHPNAIIDKGYWFVAAPMVVGSVIFALVVIGTCGVGCRLRQKTEAEGENTIHDSGDCIDDCEFCEEHCGGCVYYCDGFGYGRNRKVCWSAGLALASGILALVVLIVEGLSCIGYGAGKLFI